MSRLAVAGICAVVLLAGFVAGRVTGSGAGRVATVEQTVERSVLVPARYVGSASDARDSGPLDLARVSASRSGAVLRTTIAAHRAWSDALLRRGGPVSLSLLYDTNRDGRTDRRDVVFRFGGRLTSWISSLGQGVQSAEVTRRSATTITVARDASVFFDAAGQSGLLLTAPVGVAVVARWHGGSDRVPDSGWIAVPAPGGGQSAPLPAFAQGSTGEGWEPATTSGTTTACKPGERARALARLRADVAALRRAALAPTKDTLRGSPRVSRLTDRFLLDLATAPIGNLTRNRLVDKAAAALVGACQQCFQALEASRPIPAIAQGDRGSCS